MSSFICEQCGKTIQDTPEGYSTECEHYPIEKCNIIHDPKRPFKATDTLSEEQYKKIIKELKK